METIDYLYTKNQHTNMRNRFCFILFVCAAIAALSGCKNERVTSRLETISEIADTNPDSALALINGLEHEKSKWRNGDLMRYELIKLKAENKSDMVFTTDSMAKDVVVYFDKNGTDNEKMLAHYLQGRVYSDMGEAPEALQSYYDAISMADTTDSKCDYNTLTAIYGQMSQIFHQQNLPHNEIWALNHYIHYIRQTGNEVDYAIAQGQLIRPYYLLGEKDSVLRIIHHQYERLLEMGHPEEAVASFGSAIYIYTERHDIEKASECVRLFEEKSGIVDQSGNIAKGWEGYYYIKGFYELRKHEYNKAECCFRKAIDGHYYSEGYKGLLAVYQAENNKDSVFHYANLYEEAQDSLHNKMRTEAILQMSSLYNYSRKQKEAEQEREKSHSAILLLIFILSITFILLVSIIIIAFLHRKKQKEKEKKIEMLEKTLSQAKEQRSVIQKELQQLKEKDYDRVIEEKVLQEAELTRAIERLQAENSNFRSCDDMFDNLEDFANSAIAILFVKKATEKAERITPTEAEWRRLTSQFSRSLPFMFKSFSNRKSLSQLEQRICILIILGIPEKVISLMTDSYASTVSNAKARANEKLFGMKEAQTLKNNLIHALKLR